MMQYLVVENNNIGWATIQTIIDRGYKNLFYHVKRFTSMLIQNIKLVTDIEHKIKVWFLDFQQQQKQDH